MRTNRRATVRADPIPGDTAVVIGDGAVGLCAVLAAKRLGTARVIAVDHHRNRLELAREFGATETPRGRC